jgi:hypothetical protein
VPAGSTIDGSTIDITAETFTAGRAGAAGGFRGVVCLALALVLLRVT